MSTFPKVRKRGLRTRVQTPILNESKTRQSEAASADINKIVSKALKTGFLPVRDARPVPTSLATPDSFHEAMNIVTTTKQQFEALPAQIRNAFDNNPSKLLHAIQKSSTDETVKTQLQKLGVLETPIKSISAEQSGEAASGGEATAKPAAKAAKTPSGDDKT